MATHSRDERVELNKFVLLRASKQWMVEQSHWTGDLTSWDHMTLFGKMFMFERD